LQDLDSFLANVEVRAYRMAVMATGNPDDALDVVQDAMVQLSQRYAHKGPDEWGPLFTRILQNKILDWHRKEQRRRRWWWFGHDDDAELGDPIDQARARDGSPEDKLQHQTALQEVENAVGTLPVRQRQAFLLRVWEGLDVRETAKAMGCSEGSVKTHMSRAMNTLRQALEGHLDEN
jgi:RNA polymerase sigma-70 factor (ECF subfamily)